MYGFLPNMVSKNISNYSFVYKIMYKTFMLKSKHKKKTYQPWILEDPLPCLMEQREREVWSGDIKSYMKKIPQ